MVTCLFQTRGERMAAQVVVPSVDTEEKRKRQ